MPNVTLISGTSRPDNYTSRALGVVDDALKSRGVATRLFDARELSLEFPGHPETEDAKTLQQGVRDASAVVIATPEYHGTFCAMTKLILENMGFPSAFKGKPVALLGVAQGRIGAIKSLEQLRGVCSHMGGIVLPGAVSIAGVQKLFTKDGKCNDEPTKQALDGLAESLIEFLRTFVCPKYTLEAMVRENAEETQGWTSQV